MNIISENYEKILKEMIIKQFNDSLKKELDSHQPDNRVFNYVNMLSNLDQALCSIAKQSLVTIFETIDKSYSNSIERRRKYHIKAHLPRSILTIFGEITFMRTFYTDRHNNGSFCYLDRYLGLKKYDYFDPYIKATIIEYAANNSVPTVVTMINEFIGNRISLDNKTKFLNRQTIRNIILDSKISNPAKKELETPESLYVIADEKFVHTQNNDKKDIMLKSVVVFDGINKKPRRSLNNKRVFANPKTSKLLDEVLDYLYYTYDLDKVKNIYVMGDGAKWIKSLPSHFKINNNTNVTFALDKFHFKQAIHHICLNNYLEKIVSGYVINNMKKDFKLVCHSLIESFSHRQDTINNKKDYILNNWKYVQNLYNYKLSCPMESQISHNLAYLFTSRPKGYSLKMLNKILKIRLLYKNNENIKLLYLNNFCKNKIIDIDNNILNFDILNKYTSTIPVYKKFLYNPTLQFIY